MISWIQRSFHHHFRIIFAALLGITIISFVITIGATPGLGRADRGNISRDFFGHNLASRGEMQRLESDAALSVELQAGYSGLDEQQLQRYALERAAALHLADIWHLPAPTSAEEVDYIKSLRVFADDKGQFDSTRYDTFRRNAAANEGEISRVIGDDVLINNVRGLLTGPGYVLPSDVKTALNRMETSWTLGIATVDFASYKPEVTPTDAELAKFYQDSGARYQMPPRVETDAIVFPASDYLAKVTVTDAEIRAYYDANPGRFPAPPAPKAAPGKDGKTPPAPKADAAKDYAAVKPKVEAALKLNLAKNQAAKAASDVAYALYQAKIEPGPALDSFFAARHLQRKPLAPFTQQAGPAELGGSPSIAVEAFKLDSKQYFSEAVSTSDGAALLIWKGQMPARTPALAEVRAKVAADYDASERRKDFVALGKTLQGVISGYLKAGVTFEKAVAAAASAQSVKIEAKTLPAFTLRSQPKDLPPSARMALEHLNKGQVSDMNQAGDKGYIVYAQDQKVPSLNESSPDFTAMRSSIAGYMARAGVGDDLNEMVDAELKRSEPVVR